jgi:uncharacterized protein
MVLSDQVRQQIVDCALAAYPHAQAVYLFGSFGTEDEWPSSDVDIAILLPPEEAKTAGSLALSSLHRTLERTVSRDVDLINLRNVSTVFQKEIITTGRRISCNDCYAAEAFEMLTLSLYQKLNEERREILHQFFETGKAYDV